MAIELKEFMIPAAALAAGLGRDIPAETCKTWFRSLSDLTASEWSYAVERYLAEVESAFPLPATLRRFAMEYRHGIVPTAGEAFSSVLAAVRRFDLDEIRGMAALPDDLTRAAVNACGGWRCFANIADDNRQTVSAQFRMNYEALATRHEKLRALPDRLRPVIGLVNPQKPRIEHGATNGLELDKMMSLIGRGGPQ